MTKRDADAIVSKRFVHPNGSTSHFHVREGVVLLTSLHPEHPGNPAEIGRQEFLAAWDAVSAEAKAEGLVP